jgi:hypothetical protein
VAVSHARCATIAPSAQLVFESSCVFDFSLTPRRKRWSGSKDASSVVVARAAVPPKTGIRIWHGCGAANRRPRWPHTGWRSLSGADGEPKSLAKVV